MKSIFATILGEITGRAPSGNSREEQGLMKIAVLGATGNVGAEIVRLAAASGHDVRAVARTQPDDLPDGAQFHQGVLPTFADVMGRQPRDFGTWLATNTARFTQAERA